MRAAVLAVAALAPGCGDGPTGPPAEEPEALLREGVTAYGYEVVAAYPHDPLAWTQGLVLHDGVLYESTGLRGRSSLRRVDLETGAVLERVPLDPALFGEGMTVWKERIVQLTWTSGRGLVYDRRRLEPVDSFTYRTEGWGLTHDGRDLLMTDGSDALIRRDPDTYERLGQVRVTDADGAPVRRLNELEYVEGRVLANVWLTDRIAVIDPTTGQVDAWIDLSGLLSPDQSAGADVLNGIAYDPERRELLVTGKLWPRLYRIRLVAR